MSLIQKALGTRWIMDLVVIYARDFSIISIAINFLVYLTHKLCENTNANHLDLTHEYLQCYFIFIIVVKIGDSHVYADALFYMYFGLHG